MRSLKQAQAPLREPSAVHNVSSKQLTGDQIKVFPNKSGYNTGDAQPVDFIAALEVALSKKDAAEDSKNAIRQRVASNIIAHRPRRTITTAELKAIREIKNDEEIVTVPADKVRATVVLNKSEYVTEAQELLNDNQSYNVVDADPMKTLVGKINKTLNQMRNQKSISEKDWRQMKPQDAAIARFYGLPKIHKPNVPLGPTVALKGTPTYGLAKWLANHLKRLMDGSEHTAVSLTHFLEKLKGVITAPDEVMVSFDIISLFTSIPKELAMKVINDLLERNESLFTPPDYDFDEGPKIESVSFDEATVRKELMTLNESKSPGPDDIPPKLLKELAAELAKPLSMLFQASFEAGCLPADWKSARITPLHKGGSKASANNYRPISLTSICCKLMEKIIKRELMRFLEQHNLLSDAQHGFRSGRSCVTNLLNCLERWTRSVDEGNALHVVYIDFKKAFDSVPHQRLLHKLSRIGVRGNLLKWIQSFLLDRRQTVHVGGQQSTEVAVESGVPQGSVLGPTLFIIYVNDCVSELDCGVGMFADDIKLWSVIRTADDEEHLQANLNRLQQWSKDWLLPFNEKKCNILRVGRARSPNHMAYCLNGIPLQEVDSQKDLGVWITTSLKPSLHCKKIAKSAMSVLYLVKRTFSAFDEDCFAKVFRTFVRPQLEFAIQAWRPWTAKDISILERVQRRATKLVAGQGSLPCATRLANLDLFPLSYRQLRGDLIQAFRIIRGQDCSLVPGDFFELATTTNLRGHQFKLRVTGARLDTRKFFFSNRVIEAWNALPVDVVMSASVEVFKRKLDLCSRVHEITTRSL
ncbi:hypothetical protein SprV_0301203800 [Sparganum proliferum]